ncbi:MAG: S-layer homology domain-containing protein [Vicinamibacterales bacterium]|nr:S-layer homology domain-containing protein [Vicinamibacterales bacterium]
MVRSGRAVSRALALVAVVLTMVVAACAPRAGLPPAPTTPWYPDFVYPAVPDGLGSEAVRLRHEGGWRYLQLDNTRSAEREFQAALRVEASFFPAEAGLGWVALAREDAGGALVRFDRALAGAEAYSPALVGRGQALLALDREIDALDAFERALAADPALVDVERRVQVLRFRTLQTRITLAGAAAAAGRWDEARAAYRAAIAASPETAFLHRDLAGVERRSGNVDEALVHARRAVALDEADAAAYVLLGDLLDARADYEGAVAAYARARTLEASPSIEAAWEAARARAEFARMPEAYRSIPDAAVVTRGDLAALIGVRLAELLARAPSRQVVITDVRGHWAQAWIMTAARTGIIEAFPNYTFQPRAPVRRGDLAAMVSRVASRIAAEQPARAAAWTNARPAVRDVPPGHLSYPSVALALASGAMQLDETGAFHLLRTVTGPEVMAVVARLEALAAR